MKPTDLLKTVNLGDRACRAICVHGWNKQVVIHVDTISRIRGNTKTWDFYTGEDIPGGRIVFGEVQTVRFHPTGPLPNDLINEIAVSEIADPAAKKPAYVFTLSIGSVDDAGRSTEVIVEIKASDLYLQDPRTLENQIRE